MNISRGKKMKAQKVVVYGPEGIGKSTFASKFPDPLFIDTEDSTLHMDVSRFDKPLSWTMLLQQIDYVKNNGPCQTLVVDTADWAEKLCKDHICATSQVKSIEDFGYGKGYTMLAEEWGKFLNRLSDVIEIGINVVITAHAMMRKFEQPDEMGSYDRWELKLEKKTSPLTKEWADMVLFANYQTQVVNVDNQGAIKGKNKVQGGMRVMYTNHHPCWDAKNRFDLPDKISMEYSSIAFIFDKSTVVENTQPKNNEPNKIEANEPVEETQTALFDNLADVTDYSKTDNTSSDSSFERDATPIPDNIPKPLSELMSQNNVTVDEIQKAVSSKGYYPEDTPIQNYDKGFVEGVLIGAWEQVFDMIKSARVF